MKAHIETSPVTQRVKIWLYDHDVIGNKTYVLGPDLNTMVTLSEGEAFSEPTLEVHTRVADALASALAGHGHPEAATQRHLDDALKVRDRLLTLVEGR